MIRDIFLIDLIKSIFIAIYNDEYRHRINTDIASLHSIFQEQGEVILTSSQNEEELSDTILSRYRQTLRDFKETDCENLVYEMMKLIKYLPQVTINPLEFYKSFIDIPSANAEMVFNKISAFTQLTQQGNLVINSDFSNNLFDMNLFFKEPGKDALIYGLKLIRFLPFLIFNTYVIGGGNYHSKMLGVISGIKSIMAAISNAKSINYSYSVIGNFIIDELQYLITTFYAQMSSPMKVNTKSRHMIIDIMKMSAIPDIEADNNIVSARMERMKRVSE
jgi:hypothetical protein